MDTPNAFLNVPVRLGGIFQLRKLIPSIRNCCVSQVLKQAKENKDQFMTSLEGELMEEVKRYGIPEAPNDTKTLGKAMA